MARAAPKGTRGPRPHEGGGGFRALLPLPWGWFGVGHPHPVPGIRMSGISASPLARKGVWGKQVAAGTEPLRILGTALLTRKGRCGCVCLSVCGCQAVSSPARPALRGQEEVVGKQRNHAAPRGAGGLCRFPQEDGVAVRRAASCSILQTHPPEPRGTVGVPNGQDRAVPSFGVLGGVTAAPAGETCPCEHPCEDAPAAAPRSSPRLCSLIPFFGMGKGTEAVVHLVGQDPCGSPCGVRDFVCFYYSFF